jgi:hypothetical protein
VDARDRHSAQQRGQGDPARVIRGQDQKGGLVRTVLVGRLVVERQDGSDVPLPDFYNTPPHVFQDRHRIVQQRRGKFRIHAVTVVVLSRDPPPDGISCEG